MRSHGNESNLAPWGGGGGVPPFYKLDRYVPPHQVGFLRRFGLKTGILGIYFAYFGLESGMVFEGTTGVYERSYLSFQFQMNKNEVEIYEFFCLHTESKYDDVIFALRPGLKTVMDFGVLV